MNDIAMPAAHPHSERHAVGRRVRKREAGQWHEGEIVGHAAVLGIPQLLVRWQGEAEDRAEFVWNVSAAEQLTERSPYHDTMNKGRAQDG